MQAHQPERNSAVRHVIASACVVALIIPITSLAEEPADDVTTTQMEPAAAEATAPVQKRRGPSNGEAAFDAIALRPWEFLGLIASSAAFIPAAILTSPGGRGSISDAYDTLVRDPADYVFNRPLGDF